MNKTHKVIAVGIASAATLMVFALPQEHRVLPGGAVPAPQHEVVMTSPETPPDAVFDMTFMSQRERTEALSANAR
ncbi:MAG TPA: hypothetical protein VFP44_01730 [Usitatibacter sp.]|nr:hypothetical protein [Usitatibacter sp.]